MRWDGETQTVSSTGTEDSGTTTIIGIVNGMGSAAVSSDKPQSGRDDLIKAGLSEAEADRTIEDLIWQEGDTLNGFTSSSDADILGTDHIGCEWA